MRSRRTSPGKSRVVGGVVKGVVGGVEVHGLSHDGRGLAKQHGKTIFISGALPQEKVSIRVTEDKRRFTSAEVVSVEQPSTDRVEPPCPHFKQCGGCSLQYWSHEGQLQGKQSIVLDQLRRFSSLTPATLSDPLVSTPYGYRHRCRLSMIWRNNQLQFGFRQQQSKQIIDIRECPVLVEPLQPLLPLIKSLLQTLDKKTAVSHVELIQADSGRAVLFRHIKPLSAEDQGKLATFAKDQQLPFYLQPQPDHISCLYSPSDDPWLYNTLPEFDLKLQFRPVDFTQVNWQINRQMILQAVDWLELKASDKVLDLFCGLGNFTLAMARKAGHVVGVEGSTASVERAAFNASLNAIENTAFYQADLAALIEGSKKGNDWLLNQYDALVLDPPRAGAKEIIEQMADRIPDKVLYISCNPATLARDAGVLAEQGYKLQRLGVMDMFPQTGHVESMALFIKG
ncbi:23S rRNA (uracil(1939)-C(5))-methyltransferase RlmD [Endozoicomonas sp. OPT23]|uniref:23S rRNA (uracil(1939)-C(5))-methyltransferase RlmD n=1 Tax=Endozoicomonas sp. OPT23 TaxID=2072845 RepID=UPI00129B6C94|nr:23S rRNA (uracil(1939)-C(5))-methyltransferase RlmD [Endozoicomonas sp. OPT23]MRI34865.1 23S rRNA (uracil(1939)-C(5))-methyltransferase RlmD [Endozoicomonas sp. OPT23]